MSTPVRQPRSLAGRPGPRVMARRMGGGGRAGGAGLAGGGGRAGGATGASRGRGTGGRKRAAGSSRRLLPLASGLVGLIVLGAWWALPAFSAPPDSSPTPTAGSVAGRPTEVAGKPKPEPAAAPGASTRRPPASPPPRSPAPPASPDGSPLPAPTPAATRQPAAAPASAEEFARRGQVIEIGFPLKPSTRYRYRDNWGDLRVGSAEHYNHAHSRRDGQLRRAHDGVDLYARRGEPVLAPFDGLIVKPAELWQPWHPERYGRTAVIVSGEPASEGYISLLSHLERLWVKPGQEVRRGEVIGTVGSTGNAEGGPAHVHFELRAPFRLPWREVGQKRLVDAFNPHPSLVAADPRPQD